MKEGDVLGNALEAGFLNNHNISISGGTDRIRYRLSGNFSNENGPMVSSKDAYSRKTFTAFIASDITGWFTQEATVYYTYENRSDIAVTFRDPYSVRLINWYPEGYMPKEIVGTSEDAVSYTHLRAHET